MRASPAAATIRALVVAAAVAGAVGCGGGKPVPVPRADARPQAAGRLVATAEPGFSIPSGVTTTKAGFVYQAAADARHLAWMTGPIEEESLPTQIYVRELTSKKAMSLERGVDPGYGLASTSGWVVYGVTADRTRLVAVRYDGSGRTTLSDALAAPIAARGRLVAWAEQTTARLRVVVRDMAAGRNWVAADIPRCRGSRCWRIDGVTLADDGVVFTRVASNPDASAVVRRAFNDPAVSEVRIAGDPQPELRPSSAGALYYSLRGGWHRWDFGRARPRRTSFRNDPPVALLAFEHGRWFMLEGGSCRQRLVALGRDGRRVTMSSAARLLRLVPSPHGICAQFGGLSLTRRQVVSGWGLAPEEEEEGHVVEDLVGVVSVSRPLG